MQQDRPGINATYRYHLRWLCMVMTSKTYGTEVAGSMADTWEDRRSALGRYEQATEWPGCGLILTRPTGRCGAELRIDRFRSGAGERDTGRSGPSLHHDPPVAT